VVPQNLEDESEEGEKILGEVAEGGGEKRRAETPGCHKVVEVRNLGDLLDHLGHEEKQADVGHVGGGEREEREGS